MQASYWQQKWRTGDIGFHEAEVNPYLKQYLEKLNLPHGSRILVPLCGKTRDMAWMLRKGYQVVGVELCEIAIKQLFQELEVVPQIEAVDKLTRYSGPNITIFLGDIFSATKEHMGHIDAVYDRAALVALPAETRISYVNHLREISSTAPQLLNIYEYQQELMAGPPFSITEGALVDYYSAHYELSRLVQSKAVGELKKNMESVNSVWLLQRKT